MPYFVYMLQCSDGSYYIGMTTDLERRLNEHIIGGEPDAYTFRRRPVQLVWSEEFPTHDDAFTREHQVKGWSRKKKEALIHNDFQGIQAIVQEEKLRRNKK